MKNSNMTNDSITLMAEQERSMAERRVLGDLRHGWRRRRLQGKASIYLLALLVAVPLALAAVSMVPGRSVGGARLSVGASRTVAISLVDNVMATL